MDKRDPSVIYGRKRKRELLAFTLTKQDQPLKTLHPDNFGANLSPTALRGRRGGSGSVSHNSGGLTPGNLPFHIKPKPFSSLSALSSSSSLNVASAAASASAATSNNMRLKILNPVGYGAGLAPDQKCNFELYPSGCFDENGSICDNSGSGLCICRPGYTILIGNLYCLRPASIGEACFTTEQCEKKVAYSGCFNYREEYREENPSAFFGPSQSSWPMGECRCRIGHRYDEEKKACVKSLIGSWCSNVWDCQMVNDDEKGSEGEIAYRTHTNHSGRNSANSLFWHGGSHVRAKLSNIICDHNICNCSQFFYYNASSEECQHMETYGQSCLPDLNADQTLHIPKRNTRSRSLFMTSYSSHHSIGYHSRQLQSLPDTETLVGCNPPSICSANGTCVCAEGYEYQALSTPQCQPPNKGIGVGGHFTHHFYSGSSGRSGIKGDHGVTMYDRGSVYEGQSNIGNFFEYVMYVLVPALVIIFMCKPCFRRIGKLALFFHVKLIQIYHRRMAKSHSSVPVG